MEEKTSTLDEIDRRILVELQRDGRLTNQDLAGRIGVSASPCWRRVRALEEAGVIKGYAALVDPAALGLNVSVFTQVSLERQEKKALQVFEAAVGEWPDSGHREDPHQLHPQAGSLQDGPADDRARLNRDLSN